MQIAIRPEEYDSIIEILQHVDMRSNNPVYKNLVEIIEKTSRNDEEIASKIISLEESGIYT
ncbi:MAG: hypothetical protein ACOCUI_00615, partial [bacterium]